MTSKYQLICEAALIELPERFTPDDVIAWFDRQVAIQTPKEIKGTLRKMSVNMGTTHQSSPAARPKYMCLYQVDSGKYTRYRPEIHGLWENGCRLKRPDDEPIESAQRDADAGGAFDADSPEDARERTDRSIVVRRGQQKFRDVLLEAYERRCAIAGFDAEEALEAAHIRPYKGQEWNHVRNGLLLRSDIHTLFDRHLIAVDTSEMTVLIADSLSSTMYGNLEGRPLRAPEDEEKYGPNREALDLHRAEADL